MVEMTWMPDGKDFLHILISLVVFASGHVGMGQFVNEHNFGSQRQYSIRIHFLDLYPAIGNLLSRNYIKPVQ